MESGMLAAFFRGIALFQDLNEQELAELADLAIPRHFARKSVIFTEGSEKESVFFIREGMVKTYKTDENGNEQIVSFLKPGDMFPHAGFFNPHPYPATAEAITDAHLAAIPVRKFELLLMRSPSIAVKIMRVMGDKILELQQRLQEIAGQDVRRRLLSFLLQLAERHGERENGRIAIKLPMTNQEIASVLGTTRESINRQLNQLARENILETDRNQIVILDPEALKTSAREPE